MSRRETLSAPSQVDIHVVGDRTTQSRCDDGFLRVRRLLLRNVHADGHASEDYPYDVVERNAIDAVAIVLSTAADSDQEPRVCLRTALRPALAFRQAYAVPISEERVEPVLWEIPAGLIEAAERGEAGIRACASRETLEEVGLEVSADRFEVLGPASCPSPSVIGEKLHFVHAVVDPDLAGSPTEDGTPLEERAEVVFVPLSEALAAVRDGRVADVKSEVGLRRLAERLTP